LNGAQIKYFATLTFLHTKYIASESSSSVSSDNFDYTSYMENREAGIIMQGAGSTPLRSFITQVFNADWAIGVPFKPAQTYSSSNMQIITNKASVPVVIPPRRNINAWISPLETFTDNFNASIIISPDFAYQAITNAMNAATFSIQVMIYQITDDLCDYISNFSSIPNIQWKILVSSAIYSPSDNQLAQLCYAELTNRGFSIQVTSTQFKYSHQKFWIIDYSANKSSLPSTQLVVSTGNWGSTDYPLGSVFPPYTSPGWQKENRDYTFQTNQRNVIALFQELLDEDYAIGQAWKPPNILNKF